MRSLGETLTRGIAIPPEREQAVRSMGRRLYPSFSTTCQLRCPYCVSNMFKKNAQNRPSLLAELGVAGYLEALAPLVEETGTLEVYLGGPGEPLISPFFLDLCDALLAEGHRVHVTTNGLSSERFLVRLRRMPAPWRARVFCDVTYHRGPLTERRAREALETIARFHARGVLRDVLVTLSPDALKKSGKLFLELLTTVACLDPCPSIKLRRLSHHIQGRRYPESYTAIELATIRSLLDEIPGATMHPDVQPELLPYLGVPLELRGAPCLAPMRFLNVGLDGGLWNCYAQPFLPNTQGHLLEGYDPERVYAEGPVRCDYDECSCRVLGIEHCLGAHGISLVDYALAYHERAGNRAAVRGILDRR